jgi:signal transduction histidine kinase
VTVAVTASGVQLIVEDDGAGIPVADRDRIFDRFTRLDEARDREAGGSGLGLAIARSAVEDLGGSIVVDVSALGGAAFVVLLPSADTGPVGGRVR